MEDDLEDNYIELNQSFPMTMGLSFCIDQDILLQKGLEVKVKFRYYTKVPNSQKTRIGVLCELDTDNFRIFFEEHKLNEVFSLIKKNDNFILILNPANIGKINFEEIRKYLAECSSKETAKIYDELSRDLSIEMNPNFHRERLSGLLQFIYNKLKNEIIDEKQKTRFYNITQKLELIENITGHCRDLIGLFSNDEVWLSKPVEILVNIDNIRFPVGHKKLTLLSNESSFEGKANVKIIKSDNTESESLNNIFEFPLNSELTDYSALSMNIQFSRESRKDNKKIFTKIQLFNHSKPFLPPEDSNRFYSVATSNINEKSFFGIKISVSNDGLLPYSDYVYESVNEKFDEDTVSKFIYRQFKDYAVGHGCSVKWEIMGIAKQVETEYIPACEIPDIEPVPRDKTESFTMVGESNELPLFFKEQKVQNFWWLSSFSDIENEEIHLALERFVNSYYSWIKKERERISSFSEVEKSLAEQELLKCESDFLRMDRNVKSLQNDENKLNNFRLMNSAMFMQIFHSNAKKENYSSLQQFFNQSDFKYFSEKVYRNLANTEFSWRAFQLAFILLNLDGIYQMDEDKDWEARNNQVDLVWFPTGGGKTEAYLGLIALAIIHRRNVHGEFGGGTSAIMRYTLRLLTMQQFQRATVMIMALELLRRWNYESLGSEPITIGLWVGNSSMPNSLNDLKEEYKKLNNGYDNLIPFTACPWCGSKLFAETSVVSNSNDIYHYQKLHLFCVNNLCNFSNSEDTRSDFHGPIPINLCDETIYLHPPSLLFATVDKFAQLAHKVSNGHNIEQRKLDSRRLFGTGNWEAGKPQNGYLPPDLIIQDELHLLQGPLGSAVALFESAVDQLCTRKDATRPKIISSTATTRNTELQIAALFNRKVNLFPKSGIDSDDSYFAFYKRKASSDGLSKDYDSKRKYLGFFPTGRTQIWMQMRLSAILLAHRAIFELKQLGDIAPIDYKGYLGLEKTLDYYHTIVSYFNSLKEVGKTQAQVQTYILKELRSVINGVMRPRKLMHAMYTYELKESELTGRLSSKDVINNQFNAETPFVSSNRFAYKENNLLKRGTTPPSFIVATNMISVGLDISRFNTMIVNSMPRNIAEYIQATSRVARNDLGLVLTVHSPFRTRDISHYERFIEFHEKMYSYVEPISITPFTKKAVDRYIGLYIATILRHQIERFANRESANDILNINKTERKNLVEIIMKYFEDREKSIATKFSDQKPIKDLLNKENIEYIKNWIIEMIADWVNRKAKIDESTNNSILVFNHAKSNARNPQFQLFVDIDSYQENIHSEKWRIPTSLRTIDKNAIIRIKSN